MDELITKYDAMEAVRNTPYFDATRALIAPEQAMEAIGALDPLHEPSLLEKLRPKGKWEIIYGEHIRAGLRPIMYACGVCGMVGSHTNYCPECGAKMIKEDPEE